MYSKIERLKSAVVQHPVKLEKASKNHQRLTANSDDKYGSKGTSS
jgi:hypothetical protein